MNTNENENQGEPKPESDGLDAMRAELAAHSQRADRAPHLRLLDRLQRLVAHSVDVVEAEPQRAALHTAADVAPVDIDLQDLHAMVLGVLDDDMRKGVVEGREARSRAHDTIMQFATSDAKPRIRDFPLSQCRRNMEFRHADLCA